MITRWEWLFDSKATLYRKGVRGDVEKQRYAWVGQYRPLGRGWGRTVGLWGRVYDLDQIAAAMTGCEVIGTQLVHGDTVVGDVKPLRRKIRGFAKNRGLLYRSPKHGGLINQVRLAASVYRAEDELEDTARRFGIMRFEALYYAEAYQTFLATDDKVKELDSLDDWVELQALWILHGFMLCVPQPYYDECEGFHG